MRANILYIVLVLAILSTALASIAYGDGGKVVVYGLGFCGSCRDFMKFLDEHGISYEHRDLVNSDYSLQFECLRGNLSRLLNVSKESIVEPLTIIYDDSGYPVCIIVGDVEDIDFINRVLNSRYNGSVIVRLGSSVEVIKCREFIEYLHSLYQGGNTGYTGNRVFDPISFTGLMLGLAVADSINPCAISTTALLAITATTVGFMGRRKYLLVASFIAGVYLGYLFLGYIVSIILSLYNILLIIVLALALAIIVKDLVELARGGYRGIECTGRECLPSFISKLPAHLIPPALVGFGMIVSWTFMSCSAAPYFIFLSYVSVYVDNVFMRLMYLMIYCLVIIAPLVIVSLIPIEKVIGFRKIRRIILVRDTLLSVIVAYTLYNILLTLNIL